MEILDRCANRTAELCTNYVPAELLVITLEFVATLKQSSFERQCVWAVAFLLFVVVGYYFNKIFLRPMVWIRPHGSVGFLSKDGSLSHEDIIRETVAAKDVGKIPPVFPNGWFQAIKSDDVKSGQVKRLNILGKNWAVYRTSISKEVTVIGTYCPHLGADFSVGGKVVGDCIQCPFHGWMFGGPEGKVQDIPYSNTDKLKFVKLDKKYCVEKWGWVYVWYHIDDTPPQYELPEIERFNNFRLAALSEHVVDCHIEDIPENAADSAHLAFLHKPAMSTNIESSSRFDWVIKHDIKADWKPKAEEGQTHLADAYISDTVYINFFGRRINLLSFLFNIVQVGPGVVHIYVRCCGYVFYIIQTVTPLKPLRQRLHQDFFIPNNFWLFMAKPFITLEIIQIERDIAVWTNKTYPAAPKLTKEERVIANHRRWYRTFYSENSLRLNSSGQLVSPQRKETLDF